MVKTPWAVLLCKFKDDNSEPFTRQFYERFFTSVGAGSQNMVDYFRDVSHGKLDLGGTEVFGWYTLNKRRSDYKGSGPNPDGRQQLVEWAKQAATEDGVDLSTFYGVVVCMNVNTDLFGSVRQAVCDNLSMEPSVLGQEMGHGYGLDHSRADGSDDDYRDSWDIMSTWAPAHMAHHSEFGQIGPGLNAWNMRGRGWLDESRVWKGGAAGYEATVELRPLHRRDLPGLLAAEVGDGYLVEFRMRERWDAGIPRPAVLVHRFQDNRSYLMRGTKGQQDLRDGDLFQVGVSSEPLLPYLGVEVVGIDAHARVATVRIQHRPAAMPPVLGPGRTIGGGIVVDTGGIIIGGVRVDAGGWIIVGGRIVPVPPWNPTFRILEQLALYGASDLSSQPWSRDAIRRDALTAIAGQVEEMLADLSPFHVPAPPTQMSQEHQEYERDSERTPPDACG